MYNNAINSCIEDLKTEILSFMPVSYDFLMLPLASGLMKGSRLALIETSKICQRPVLLSSDCSVLLGRCSAQSAAA